MSQKLLVLSTQKQKSSTKNFVKNVETRLDPSNYALGKALPR